MHEQCRFSLMIAESFQKKQWLEMKKQFKKLFNRDDKDWEEVDKTIEEKE